MLGAIGVFLAAQYFSARILLKLRGSPFLHKQKFLQIGCAGAKARFSDAQLIFIKPYTHGKSQRSEIFVNKAAEPRRKRAMPDRVLRETRLVRNR